MWTHVSWRQIRNAFGTSTSITARRHEMTSWPEMAVDDPMRRKEMLCLFGRLEPLHLPFSASGRPMRIFSSIIQVSARAMPDIRQDGTLSNTVTAQAISDEPPAVYISALAAGA